METKQIIIAYRNPLEMWIWESGLGYPLFAIFLALVAFSAYRAFKS